MTGLNLVEKKIRIQGNGIRIPEGLFQQLREEGYSPIPIYWLGNDISGPLSLPNTDYGENSPFELRKGGEGYQVFENGKFFVNVDFYRRPGFFDFQWSPNQDPERQGTLYIDEGLSGVIPPNPCVDTVKGGSEGDIFKPAYGEKFPFIFLGCYNNLNIWPNMGCIYDKEDRPCRFCCLPEGYAEERMLSYSPAWFEEMAEAVESAVAEIGPEIDQCTIIVNGGTLPGRDKGARVHIQVLEAIRKRLGSLPEMVAIRAVLEPPLDEEWLYALRESGYTSIKMDVDVYDEEERKKVMPNAKGFRPLKDYERAFKKAREIFPGEVGTQLVMGIHGIQSDETLLRGVEHFASLGVPTLLLPFLPYGHGQRFKREGGASTPSADRILRIYERAAEIFSRYGVPPHEFTGGVSSLAEFMGKRQERASVFKNPPMGREMG